MNETELIAKQAIEIASLTEQLESYKTSIKNIRRLMYCIGGPLNDNVLGFDASQINWVRRVEDETLLKNG